MRKIQIGNTITNYLYILKDTKPMRCIKCIMLTIKTPKPYFKLRLKLIEEASSKYFVGQLISAI